MHKYVILDDILKINIKYIYIYTLYSLFICQSISLHNKLFNIYIIIIADINLFYVGYSCICIDIHTHKIQ